LICDEEFKQYQNFSHHLQIHESEHPFICHYCSRSCPSQSALDEHTEIHLHQIGVGRKDEYLLKGMQFPSDTVKKYRSPPQPLKSVHNIIIKKSQPAKYTCSPAKYTCSPASVKATQCRYCLKVYKHQTSLQRHSQSHNNHEMITKLQQSGRLRTAKAKPLINCRLCTEMFPSKCHLERHIHNKHFTLKYKKNRKH